MTTAAQRERAALADLVTGTGPDAPTLCGQWSTRDLLAHLVLRETRLDAAPGIAIAPLAGWTRRVQDGIAQREWRRLVADLGDGPPWWSPFRLLDPVVNGAELFVHHEDVRRAQPGWEPRLLPASQQEALWNQVRLVARLGYRHSPVGVLLRRTSGATTTARRGPRAVTLVGEPAELLLHAFGRDEVRLEAQGTQADVDTVLALDRSF